MGEVRLNHHRGGSGEPLVAIHGIGSCWRVWAPMLPALEARHDVLALDLPGYGESAPVAGEPGVTALADAVADAMDAAGMPTAHLLGSSLGGWIAAELAARGRARSVVAISPAGLWTRREWVYSDRFLRLHYALAPATAAFADLLSATAVRRRAVLGSMYARAERVEPGEAAHQMRMLARATSFTGTLDWIAAGPRMPLGLREIRCPFRVVWGSRDVVLPPRQAARWARIVPRAELVPLPGLGHLAMGDDPALIADVTLDFTTATRAPSAAPA